MTVEYSLAPNLTSGSSLTFARCDRSESDPAPCAADELEHIELDLAALIGDHIWSGTPPEFIHDEPPHCDYRFTHDPFGAEALSYEFAGYDDVDGVRTLLINGVPSFWEEGGEDWFDTVGEALVPAPDQLILDQRFGGG